MMYHSRKKSLSRWMALLITLAMCLSVPMPVMAAGSQDTYKAATGVNIELHYVDDNGNVVMEKNENGYDTIKEDIVVKDDKVVKMPEGMSYDPATATLTLNNYNNKNRNLYVSHMSDDANTALTINLVGNNKLHMLSCSEESVFRDNRFYKVKGWTRLKGSGELNITSMYAPTRFVMESGTLNIMTDGKYYWNTYAFNNTNLEPENKNDIGCARFLGGKVNIDYSSMPDTCEYDENGQHHSFYIANDFVGLDVQAGNIEIRNADISINLGDHGWLGLGAGLYRSVEEQVGDDDYEWKDYVFGGKLTMENGSLEIIEKDCPAYFYSLANEGNPLHYYVGKGSAEKEVSFENAFSLGSLGSEYKDAATGEVVPGRYELNEGYTYICITTEKKQLGHTHEYGAPQWKWAADHSSATASFTCAANDDTQTVNASVTSAVTKEATETTEGVKTYTASAEFKGRKYTDTKTESIPKLPKEDPVDPDPDKPDPVDPTPVKPDPVDPNPSGFKDVPSDAYFAEAVDWAVENGITNGINATMFGPSIDCRREHVVTFLWRAAGKPNAGTHSGFKDVSDGAYYAQPVKWAVEEEITFGIDDDHFGPERTCTRGQIVTFLWRYAGCPFASEEVNFRDVPESQYYYDAVAWALENGITMGTGKDTFSPNANCTRGQIVTFLYRAAQANLDFAG